MKMLITNLRNFKQRNVLPEKILRGAQPLEREFYTFFLKLFTTC